MPTAAQIEGTVVYATNQVYYREGGVWKQIHPDDIDGIPTVRHALTGNRDNPLAFGDMSESAATLAIINSPERGATWRAVNWGACPVRIQLGFSGANPPRFEGVVVGDDWDLDSHTIRLDLVGYSELINRCKSPTPLIKNRRAFTATTIASVENPAAVGYKAGYGNRLLWDAGGRPLEQDFVYESDPARLFWYSCDDALIEVPFAHAVSGESHWTELQATARAAGGQVLQRPDGVVVYWSPFRVTSNQPVPPFHITEDLIVGNVTRRRGWTEQVGTQIVRFTKKAIQPEQEVWALDAVKYLPPGGGPGSGIYGTVALPVELPYPIDTDLLTRTNLAAGQVVDLASWVEGSVTDYGNAQITPQNLGGNVVQYVVDEANAQSLRLTLRHTFPKPIQVHSLALRAFPVQTVLQGEERAGSGEPERTYNEEPLIQDEIQAARLASMQHAFWSVARPIIQFAMWFDPRREIGEWCELSIGAWGWANLPVVLLSLDTVETGELMQVEAIPVADLPHPSTFYVVGQSLQGGTLRLVW